MKNYPELSDVELTGLLKLNNRDAFNEIYSRYKRPLFIHAHNKIHDRQEAEDIIHDIFTSLWSRRLELNFTSHLAGYLFKAVKNRILDHYSLTYKTSVYIQSLQALIEEGESKTDYLLRENEMNRLIDQEIALLPKKMRMVFELSRKMELSHKEIAASVGISEQTVRKHIQHALQILRNKLGMLALINLWIYS